MVKPTSKKPGKGIKNKTHGSFQQLLAPGLRQVFLTFNKGTTNWQGIMGSIGAQRMHPGAVFGVSDVDEFTNVSDSFCKTERVLPPGVPLDVDLFEAILKHLKWDSDSRFRVEQDVKSGVYTAIKYQDAVKVQETCANALEQIYMEAVWRQINKKK